MASRLFSFSLRLIFAVDAVLLLLFSDRRENKEAKTMYIHFFVGLLDTCNPKLFGGGDEIIPHGLNPISRRGLCASFFSLINNFARFPKERRYLSLSVDPAFFDTSCFGLCVFGCYSWENKKHEHRKNFGEIRRPFAIRRKRLELWRSFYILHQNFAV